MKLSVVATMYQSSQYLEEFCRRAKDAAAHYSGNSYEIILVNDGSPDNSLETAKSIALLDPHVVVVDLSRNFGHHKAMMTGLSYSTGDQVFLLDCDLEEEPEWLVKFQQQLEIENCDVVYGVQGKRKGGRLEQLTGSIFYRLFRKLTGVNQSDNIVTARLMSRRYVEALLMHRERELNIGGLWVITGFQQTPCQIVKHATSPTTYSLSKKFSHLVNAVTSFSSLPLVFTFYSGLAISLTALLYIVYLVFRYLFISSPPDGYTSIIASVWLFSGLIIFFIGIQGIYISKIFTEVKNRPYTITREVYRSETSGEKE
ncbi:glycosyltransferase family 2 protein [Pseudomonas sp. TE3610]